MVLGHSHTQTYRRDLLEWSSVTLRDESNVKVAKIHYTCIRMSKSGAGEIAQWLRMVVPSGDSGSIFSTHMVVHNHPQL